MSEITRFLIFAAIGLFNSILDIAIWRTLVGFFKKQPGISSAITKLKFNIFSFAHIISFVITVISSYILNSRFTFGDSKKVDNLQPAKFLAVAVFSGFLTTLFLQFLTGNETIKRWVNTLGVIEQSFTKKQSLIIKEWPTLAKFCTILLSMITNYVGYKIFVF